MFLNVGIAESDGFLAPASNERSPHALLDACLTGKLMLDCGLQHCLERNP
jgi:hypothetical protein